MMKDAIHSLRRNAEANGDDDTVTLCLLALQGNAGALRMVTEMLKALAS